MQVQGQHSFPLDVAQEVQLVWVVIVYRSIPLADPRKQFPRGLPSLKSNAHGVETFQQK